MSEKSKYQDIDAVDAALDKGVAASEYVTELEQEVDGEKKEETCDFSVPSYYINLKGTNSSNASFDSTDYVAVEENAVVKYTGYSGNPASVAPIAAYNANKEFVAILLTATNAVISDAEITIPSGVAYIRACAANSNHSSYVSTTSVKVVSAKKSGGLKDNVTELNDEVFGENVCSNIPFSLSQQYINLDGTNHLYQEKFDSTDFVEVVEEDKVIYTGYSGNPASVAPIAAYNANKEFVAILLTATNAVISDAEITIPSGVSYIRACAANSNHSSYVSSTSVKVTYNESLRRSINKLSSADENWLKGKIVAVIGDSISTNGDYGSGTDTNVPEIIIGTKDVGVELSAYLTYYDVQAGLSLGGRTFTTDEIGTEVTFKPTTEDVGKIIGRPYNNNANSVKVWWEVAAEELGFSVIPVCWSGASITSHEESDSTKKCSHSWHDSQIRKCGIRTEGTMERTAPDVIIVYRGTNDFSHLPFTRLTDGLFDSVDFSYPTTDYNSQAYTYGYLEGLSILVSKLRTTYPNAKIFLCTLNVFKRSMCDEYPTRNYDGSQNPLNSLPQYNNAIRKAADFFGCGIIEFDKDGITFENCYSQGYITDNSDIVSEWVSGETYAVGDRVFHNHIIYGCKTANSDTTWTSTNWYSGAGPTHPNDKGHLMMGKKAIADLLSQYK